MAKQALRVDCHQRYFVTGTDTGVGKTLVAAGLLFAASASGLRSVGIKPVASGCTPAAGMGAVSEDALALRKAASVSVEYADVNPVALKRPIAPHLAAAESGIHLCADDLARHCRRVVGECSAQLAIVEGAGGWFVPLNASETMADVCIGLGYQVVLVVGMRLGCLNHALLTMHAVKTAGLGVAGWVANCAEPDMTAFEDNLQTLRDLLPAPLLGVVPYLGPAPSAEMAVKYLQFDRLMQVQA